jgi:hypothetical protein
LRDLPVAGHVAVLNISGMMINGAFLVAFFAVLMAGSVVKEKT